MEIIRKLCNYQEGAKEAQNCPLSLLELVSRCLCGGDTEPSPVSSILTDPQGMSNVERRLFMNSGIRSPNVQ